MNSNGVENLPQVIFYVTLLEVILRGLKCTILGPDIASAAFEILQLKYN